MNKLHLITLLYALVLTWSFTQARSLSPDEALSFVSGQAQKIKDINDVSMQLSYIQKVPNGNENGLYVFSNKGANGFAIVAADDAVGQLLLGYSDSESFDINDVPPSMQVWMDAWASTVQSSAETGETVSTVRSGRLDVSPIVKTKWNQDRPYNDKCPIVEGKRSVTGCVATSVAQVMNVHQWPETGQGTVSYDWTVNGTIYNESLDFSTVTFDWEAMLNTYNDNSNTRSCEAVATLMYACGIGAHMSYSPDESGATEFQAATSLIQNFGYDIGLSVQKREWYTAEQWDDIIYSQLIKGLAIAYTGREMQGGGHQFVIDGYDTSGYYHVNWGWGGLSDGYFKLCDLDPSSQGIGGSSAESGFNFDQSAIVDIQKPVTGSKLYTVMAAKNMATGASSYKKEDWIKFTGIFRSYALDSWKYNIGVHIVGKNIDAYISSGDNFETIESLFGYSTYYIDGSKFPTGEYDVYPAFCPEHGEWQDMKYPVETWTPLHFSVVDDKITVINPNAPGSVYANFVGYESVNGTDDHFYTGHSYSFTYDIESDGMWKGNTQVLLIKDNYFYCVSESKDVEFNHAEKQTLSYTMQIDADIDGGEYELLLTHKTDYGYIGVSDRILIEVIESPVTGSGYVSDVEFVNSPSPGVSEDDPSIIVKDAARIDIILEATDAPWQDDVWIYFADANSLSIIGQSKSQPISIDKIGDFTTLTFTGPWDGLETDRVYAMAPWAKGANQLCNPYYFKLVDNGSAYAQLVFVGSSGDGLNEVASLDSKNQIIEAKIQCNQAPFKDNLRLAFADIEGSIIGWSDYKYVELPEPDSSDILTFEGPWDFLDQNTYYLTTLFNNKYEYISNIYTFMIEEKIFPTEISLSEQSLTMEIDDVQVLKAYVYPEEASYEQVEWTSSDVDVASVILNGRVRAWKEGVATITASVQGADGLITATCEIKVIKHSQTISWDQEFDEVEQNSVITLTASASSGLAVEYQVTKGKEIVTIDENTLIINGEGEIEILATQPGNDEYEVAEPVCKMFWSKARLLNAINDRLTVHIENNILTILGLKAGEIVRLYTSDGKQVYYGTEHRILLQHNQTYLLIVCNTVTKLHTR